MRGGEQRGENDQSVTQTVRQDGRRELDSVGVGGRVFDRKTKPAKRAIGGEPNRRAAGRSPVVAPMVGDGMAGSPSVVIRETRQCWWRPWANSPSLWLAGVRASVVAAKRVMTVERRDAGRWKYDGETTDKAPTLVPARADRRRKQPSTIDLVDTEVLDAIPGDEAKSRSLSTEHPPTGKPDAGNPPVRFGGRGGALRHPYPYLLLSPVLGSTLKIKSGA